MSVIQLGADPEFMVVDKQGNLHSAAKFTKGGKEDPEDLGKGYSVQYDNIMLEMGCPPASTPEEFADIIQEMIARARKVIGAKYRLLDFNTVTLPGSMDKLPEASMFGCEATKNIYFLAKNDEQMRGKGRRCAGGHIHIAHPPTVDREWLIPLLDIMVEGGLSKQKNYSNYDRLRYYPVGEYREKPYGTEYRTPGNAWTTFSRKGLEILAQNIFSLVEYLNADPDGIWDWDEEVDRDDIPRYASNMSMGRLHDKYSSCMKKAFGMVDFVS